MPIHVAIASTQGLVFVHRLTQEDILDSLVCLKDTTKTLSISLAYADFVRRGSGLIERDFGHAGWRLDLSDNIDSGISWQLPVYIAHYLFQRGLLGDGDPQTGDTVIVASGEVLATNKTRAVQSIPKKYLAAQALMTQWQKDNITSRWLVNSNNLDELVKSEENAGLGISVQALDSLSDIESVLLADKNDLSSPATVGEPIQVTPQELRHQAGNKVRVLVILIASLFGLSLLSAWAFEQDIISSLDEFSKNTNVVNQPSSNDVLDEVRTDKVVDTSKLEGETPPAEVSGPKIFIARNRDRFLCGHSAGKREFLIPSVKNIFSASLIKTICEIRFIPVTTPDDKVKAYLYALDSGAWLALNWIGTEPGGWQIPLPKSQSADRSYLIIQSGSPVEESKVTQLKDKLGATEWEVGLVDVQKQIIEQIIGKNIKVFSHQLQTN